MIKQKHGMFHLHVVPLWPKFLLKKGVGVGWGEREHVLKLQDGYKSASGCPFDGHQSMSSRIMNQQDRI